MTVLLTHHLKLFLQSCPAKRLSRMSKYTCSFDLFIYFFFVFLFFFYKILFKILNFILSLSCCWLISVCLDYVQIYSDKRACMYEELDAYDNGTCYNENGTLKALWNQTLAKSFKIERTLPSEEYFEWDSDTLHRKSFLSDMSCIVREEATLKQNIWMKRHMRSAHAQPCPAMHTRAVNLEHVQFI